MPANLMTPKIVADEAKKALEPLGVTVNAHEKKWIQAEDMGSFLSVSHGSKQDPIFLEMFYNGTDATTAPFVIAGFDSFRHISSYTISFLSLFFILFLNCSFMFGFISRKRHHV